jgi:hypothetical protein
MIPALRLVPPGHTLVTLGERFFGGLTLYYDRAPRGAPYFPRIRIGLFSDFRISQPIVLAMNCDILGVSCDCRFRKSGSAMFPKSICGSAKS